MNIQYIYIISDLSKTATSSNSTRHKKEEGNSERRCGGACRQATLLNWFAKNWQDMATISYSAVCRSSSCFEQQVAILFLSTVRLSCSFVCSVCLGLLQENLRFKFAKSGKIRRIWNTLMKVWMTGYLGFLLEATGLFIDEAKLFSCFGQQIAIFRVKVLSRCKRTRYSRDLDRKILR